MNAVTAIESVLVLIGLILLVIGYRKSNRNVLLVAALVLLTSGTFNDFAEGFWAGAKSSAHISG